MAIKHIFISHANADAAAATQLAEHLKNAGHDTKIDTHDLGLGDNAIGFINEGIAKGRSYVSDGYAHALDFRVNGQPMGGEVKLDAPGKVKVTAKVAFASEIPLGTAKGGQVAPGKKRTVELIVNGQVADSIAIAVVKPHPP